MKFGVEWGGIWGSGACVSMHKEGYQLMPVNVSIITTDRDDITKNAHFRK